MPVLVTIATINALFRPGSESVSFLDPALLRARCRDVIEDTETREQAVMLTFELEQLASRYDEAVTASLNAYLDMSAKWESSVDELLGLMEPLDVERMKTLQEIVYVRRLMHEILSAEQWERIFR